ncbi:MAG: ATP-binding cassette domain-containing protein [Firmicutes bacterium]|nr:ATP-binding cassette domain-containing protein [Bacillota bacterium]
MSEKDERNYRQTEYVNEAYFKILNSASSDNNSEIEVILRYLGYDYRVKANTLRQQFEEVLNELGLSFRFVELSGEWYTDNMLPLMVWHNGEYKAVLPGFKGTCYYYDGKNRKRITGENADEFDTTGICFYKGFKKGQVTKAGLIKYMLSCVRKREYLLMLAAAALVTLFSVLYAQMQHHIFQSLIPSGSGKYVASITAFLLGLAISMFVVNVFKGVVSANIPLVISANLQGALIARLLRLKPSFFEERQSGSLGENIIRLSDVSDMISGENVSALMSFVLSFVYIAMIRVNANEFTPYVLMLFAITLVMNVANALVCDRYTKKFQKNTNEMTGFVYELFGGMENVKLNNADATMFDRWSDYYTETLMSHKKPLFIKHYNAFYALISAVYTMAIYMIGIRSNIGAADFITFMALYGMFVATTSGISKVFDSVVRYNTAFSRIEDFLRAETEETGKKADLKGIEKAIAFSNVSYKYPNADKDVISDMSFSIPKGKKIGIVGKSGCGKSTLLKLLLGFEQPYSGHIFIDDTDLNEINLRSYRKNLGVVLQNTKLIPADIISNITLTSPSASNDEVMAAIEAMGLKGDIEKMPMGLSTYISEENMSISVGQKQRVLLARAIISKPALLVLDEATNALDNITQAAVTRYIENTETTAIIVAHRLSTIKQCDDIIVLDNGKIAEQGSYDELIAKNGQFYELVKNQL